MTTQTIAFITGASRGLGYAMAQAMAGPDTHIIAVARTVGGLEELDDAIKAKGGTATLVPLDITDEDGLQKMGLAIHERWGHIDRFVHCAAHASPLSPVGHASPKDIDTAWTVNARATQRLITMLDPLLRAAQAPRAIMADDTKADRSHFSTYAASKEAARAFWDAWCQESKVFPLEVRRFEPAPMPTALRARFYPGEDRDTLNSTDSQAAAMLAELER